VQETKPSLVILAAGMGRRYGGLKQIDPVGPNGEIVIEYSIYDALRAGFGKVVFVIRDEIEAAFRDHVSRRFDGRFPYAFAYQRSTDMPAGFDWPAARQKPWGTGHALLAAAEAVDGPFAVINADDYYGRESYAAIARFLAGDALSSRAAEAESYGMVGFRLGHTLSDHGSVARGICQTDADNLLLAVEERTRIEPSADGIRYMDDSGQWQPLDADVFVSLNLWGFAPSIFGHLRRHFTDFLEQHGEDPEAEFFLPTVVDGLLKAGQARVQLLPTEEHWLGVTYPGDKPVVVEKMRQMIDSGTYPPRLWD